MEYRYKFLVFVIAILINITSPWLLRILKEEIINGVVIFLLSIGIALGLAQIISRKKLFLALTMLVVFTAMFSFKHFDKEIFKPNALEAHIIKVRQGYYQSRFGPWFHNSVTLSFYKIQRNFFSNINYNQFFFGGAPRFRSYALDFEKYPLVYLGFFLYGLFALLRLEKKLLTSFLAFSFLVLLILAVASPSIMLGLYPLYPLMTSIIVLGAYKLVLNIKQLKGMYE